MLIVVLASYQLDAQSRNEIDAAMLKVKRYLLLSPRLVDSDDTQWLPNSGKIGVGYDLVKGSPVCYTGQCQMEGFRQPVFKLDMTKRAEGSCTNKFIPKNVNLDCLPSTQITANTESITTLDQLMENTKRNIDFSFSMDGFGLLGGIAQQNIIVSEENQKNLRMNGFTTAHQTELKIAAASIFFASTKLSMTEQIDETRLNTFKKFSQQNSIITLSGGVSMQSIEEWSKTVSSNPTIIKFGIAPIIDLLTARHFPQDVKITSKRDLIRRVLEIYLTNQLFCYNNCSQHGLCVATKYFGFGQCLCNREWSGIDCSIAVGSGKVHTLISTQPIGLKLEGILGYVYGTKQRDACPLYRYWKSGQHFYTVDPCEIGVAKPGSIGSHGFKSEGIAAYVLTTFKCETIACQ
ncbi:unnamed protein product [Rotaria socialis]|uniref:EGF-like domain-containing protein n=1 Tax=Rotaria socialis TaxID=392032 RepID=A0A820YV70_9BILA|nr:unnamed protein product [Rotaria socialis]